MATYTALAATTSALMRMLTDGFPTNSASASVLDPVFNADDGQPGLLWLHRFVPVPAMRNRPMPG
jgi:hypothetical protein